MLYFLFRRSTAHSIFSITLVCRVAKPQPNKAYSQLERQLLLPSLSCINSQTYIVQYPDVVLVTLLNLTHARLKDILYRYPYTDHLILRYSSAPLISVMFITEIHALMFIKIILLNTTVNSDYDKLLIMWQIHQIFYHFLLVLIDIKVNIKIIYF